VLEDRTAAPFKGGCAIAVAAALAGAGLPLAVVDPCRIRAFARAPGRLARTDRLAARIIAPFAARVRPQARPVADDAAPVRTEPVETIGMESRRRRTRDPGPARRSDTRLAWRQKALAERDRDRDDTVRGAPAWRASSIPPTSVPGIGAATACSLSAGLPELGRPDRHEFAARAGLGPIDRDSGSP
jgi:transposase